MNHDMEQRRRFRSEWGWAAAGVVAFAAAVCGAVAFVDFDWVSLTVSVLCFLLILVPLFGIYYVIEGDTLIVYYCFVPQRYPIGRIAEIRPTRSALSAPAISISKRIAITFADKSVMRSSAPLVISPVRRQEFLDRLRAANPAIHLRDF